MKKKLSHDEIEPFEKLQDDVKNNPYILRESGLKRRHKRVYPYNSLACSVLGFTAAGNQGINGLEASYDGTLNGVDGRKYGYLNEDSNYESTVKAPQNGDSIVSTIDANIQDIVEKKIKAFNKEHQDAATKGLGSMATAVLVMDPNNGEVLAMADYPFYDLNDPRNLDGLVSKSKQEKCQKKRNLII